MTAPLFVDANVFLYASDDREPVKQPRAIAWLDRLWQEQSGRTSIQVLSEYYVDLTRKSGTRLPAQEAWTRVAKYLAWEPQPVDETLFRRAREVEQRHRISWWDSMIVAAAQLQDCALLLTEDLQDSGVYGAVTVRSPFTLDVREAAAIYAVLPRAANPHRPRGRPRRAVRESELL
ncbi:MAG: PIN domain-containing protein [Betaproteobacteria bacterium]|nr:PIN domain-containing protein [Betaproteobacteria bacterium]